MNTDEPRRDLEAEATELANSLADEVKKKEQLRITVGVKSGKLRRNSVCPCGSGFKYKKCCMADVDAGIRPRIRTRGATSQPPTKRVRPKKYGHNRYARKTHRRSNCWELVI